MSDTNALDAKEQAIAEGFNALLRHVRENGLSDKIEVVETWLPHVKDRLLRGEMTRLLGFYWLRAAHMEKALRFSDMASELLPENTDSVYNAVYALLQAGRWADVVPRAEAALARFGDMFQWHNILCTAHGKLGQLDAARKHGTRCLELKDAAATEPALALRRAPVPPFNPRSPERNAVSFSLFGTNERYLRTAIVNAGAIRVLYLGWTCRFYIDDTVPELVVKALMAEGAAIMKVPALPANPFGTFWRFLAADDPGVDRYIVRDADSVVNVREAAAVQEWIDSGRHFHVMRDNFDHGELILAGMWGGTRPALPPLLPWAQRYLAARSDLLGRTADQEFLRDQLWPTIKTSMLTHDSQFDFGEHRDFPACARLPEPFHVGCDGSAMLGLGAPA